MKASFRASMFVVGLLGLCITSPASAQNFWGQLGQALGGNNNNNRGGFQNRGGNQSGGWFETKPKYRYETRPKYGVIGSAAETGPGGSTHREIRGVVGSERVRIRDGSTTTFNPGNMVNDIANAAGSLGNGGGRNNNGPYYPPTYTQPQPTYNQPTYVQPVSNTTTSTPPKNKVVANKPASNPKPALNLARTSAELDLQTAKEAAAGGGQIDAALERQIDTNDQLTKAEKDDLKRALQKAVQSGDERDYQDLLDKMRATGKMNSDAETLETRIELIKTDKIFSDPSSSQAAKDAQLQNVRDSLADWSPTHTLHGPMQTRLDQMDQNNQLSKLADLSQGTDNPLAVMIMGFQNAGFSSQEMSEVTGMPIMNEPAAADSTVQVADILLMNPEENAQTINYTIANHPYAMKPGEKQPLDRTYDVSFDPGNGTGTKRYTLSSGVYHFVIQSGAGGSRPGWDLTKITPRVVIDNSRYSGTFSYLMNGRQVSLAPGQTIEHTSETAIVIEFDRGDGSAPARKVVSTGTLVVGVDAAKQCLDLYPAPEAATLSTSLTSNAFGAAAAPDRSQASRQRQIEETLARLKARNN